MVPSFFTPGLDRDVHGVPLPGGDENFFPVVDEFNGFTGLPGEPGRAEILGEHVDLLAETAPHLGLDHPDLAFGDHQSEGQVPAQEKGDLGGGIEDNFPFERIVLGNGGVRFQGGMIDRLGIEPVFKNEVAFLKGLFHISEFLADGKRGVMGDPVVDERRPFLNRLQGVEHGGEFLIVHPDQLQGLFGNLRVHGADGGHVIADIAHLIPGQGMLVMGLGDDAVDAVRNIFSGHHPFHAGQFLGPGGVDVEYPGMGQGTAQNFTVQHSRQQDIIRELGRALGLGGRVVHRQSLTDYVECGSHLGLLPGRRADAQHRLNDFFISGAAAKVSGHFFLDGFLRRIGFFL